MSLGNPLDPITHLDSVNNKDTWYGPYIKPAIMFVAFTMFSYATLWMGQHYVTNEKFGEYVKVQVENDKRQDSIYTERFNITQSKLETIINQQVSYTEQLKAYSQIMVSMQKQLDNIDNRVIYLERNNRIKE
jgi:hypothetical protein